VLGSNGTSFRTTIYHIGTGSTSSGTAPFYEADYDAVLDGVEKFNERSWTSATLKDFATVQARVLEGEVVGRVRQAPIPPWDG
jgi:hypothetical protein